MEKFHGSTSMLCPLAMPKALNSTEQETTEGRHGQSLWQRIRKQQGPTSSDAVQCFEADCIPKLQGAILRQRI